MFERRHFIIDAVRMYSISFIVKVSPSVAIRQETTENINHWIKLPMLPITSNFLFKQFSYPARQILMTVDCICWPTLSIYCRIKKSWKICTLLKTVKSYNCSHVRLFTRCVKDWKNCLLTWYRLLMNLWERISY